MSTETASSYLKSYTQGLLEATVEFARIPFCTAMLARENGIFAGTLRTQFRQAGAFREVLDRFFRSFLTSNQEISMDDRHDGFSAGWVLCVNELMTDTGVHLTTRFRHQAAMREAINKFSDYFKEDCEYDLLQPEQVAHNLYGAARHALGSIGLNIEEVYPNIRALGKNLAVAMGEDPARVEMINEGFRELNFGGASRERSANSGYPASRPA